MMRAFQLYTDGRCEACGRGAAAYVVLEDDRIIQSSGRILEKTTSNDAEYLALINGLRYFYDLELEDLIITHFTDSDTVVGDLTGGYQQRSRGLIIKRNRVHKLEWLLQRRHCQIFRRLVPRNEEYIQYAHRLCKKVLKEHDAIERLHWKPSLIV